MSGKIRVPDLIRMREQDQKIVMLTAYDYTFARLVDSFVDVLLVGDSLGTVVQGHETTLPVTLDQMVYHCSMVARGAERALVVGDMPFMSFQLGPKEALAAAGRLVKEGGVAAVKIEGAGATCSVVRAIVEAGIPVMGHIGLTPQSVHAFGGYRVQGKGEGEAERLLEEAKELERAGAFSVVLEALPGALAGRITKSLSIPTIGIGAGVACAGQVLVLHDVLGLTVHEETRKPRFVNEYAALRETVTDAISRFAHEVRKGEFPDDAHTYSASSKKESATNGAVSRCQ